MKDIIVYRFCLLSKLLMQLQDVLMTNLLCRLLLLKILILIFQDEIPPQIKYIFLLQNISRFWSWWYWSCGSWRRATCNFWKLSQLHLFFHRLIRCWDAWKINDNRVIGRFCSLIQYFITIHRCFRTWSCKLLCLVNVCFYLQILQDVSCTCCCCADIIIDVCKRTAAVWIGIIVVKYALIDNKLLLVLLFLLHEHRWGSFSRCSAGIVRLTIAYTAILRAGVSIIE